MDAVGAAALERVVWVPVRHHSPAAARVVGALIRRHRPEAVLIEGPAEFTDIDQLSLDHELPIAIMTWLRFVADGHERHSHALYPFTEFSAEWQAIRAAREVGAQVAFIDLPWAGSYALRLALAGRHDTGEESAAAAVTQAEPGPDFFATIAAHVGREDLSAVWDEFFEIDPALDPDDYLARAHALGGGLRLSDVRGADDRENVAREAHMADAIAATLAATTGPVVVVTGAFHTAGLQALLRGEPGPRPAPAPVELPGLITGTALIPTSYETLDAHRGYLAGQPSPGFYHRIHAAPAAASADVVADLFAESVAALRARGVPLSPADAIAAMTTAKALQELRGHARLWRDDLLDGIAGAVVKDDLDEDHPLLEVVRATLRGDVTGRLAPGADVPPLVHEVRRRWAEADLPPGRTPTVRVLDLNVAAERDVSRLLHALRVLDVPAAALAATATAANARASIGSTERWTLHWDELLETSLITATRWGGSLEQAVTAVLEHRARLGTPEALADVLTDAVRAGLDDVSGRLGRALTEVLAGSDELAALGRALSSLVRLVHYDTWLGTVGRQDLSGLARFAHARTTDVLERLGPVSDGAQLPGLVAALRELAESTVTLGEPLSLDAGAVARALRRQTERPPGSPRHDPEFEGALIGAGWLLSGDPGAALEARLADPGRTGRFYSGLLAVAGHLAIAAPQIFTAADDALRHWDDDAFLEALPDLRRAMRSLTARERAALLRHLTGERARAPELTVDAEALVELGRREARLWESVARWTGGAA